MSPFNTDDYIDVAERIRIFIGKYPEGTLQSEISYVEGGVLCKAYAYRTPDDPRPGIGHAWEPIPGKTNFTRDSETMNAETSAWGRAIVACGFETKKIASADEVRAREGNGSVAPATDEPGSPPVTEHITDEAYQAYLEATARAQQPGAIPSQQVIHFGKNKGLSLGQLNPRQLAWYANEWKLQDEPSEYDHRLKQAAVALNAGTDTVEALAPVDDGIPF